MAIESHFPIIDPQRDLRQLAIIRSNGEVQFVTISKFGDSEGLDVREECERRREPSNHNLEPKSNRQTLQDHRRSHHQPYHGEAFRNMPERPSTVDQTKLDAEYNILFSLFRQTEKTHQTLCYRVPKTGDQTPRLRCLMGVVSFQIITA
jgi:hypothetical protein